MPRSTPRRPSASLVVASLALVVACTGSGYAAGVARNSVGTAQLKANAVTSAKVANDSLTGADVKESSLSGLLRTTGCQRGTILGFVRVLGDDFGKTTEYGTAGLDIPYNCAGGVVEMRHPTTGEYVVRFVGNPAEFAFAQVRYDRTVFDEMVCSTVKKTPRTEGGIDSLSFTVSTFSCAYRDYVDADFTLMLP